MPEPEAQWCQWEMQKDKDASIFWMLHEGVLYIRVAIKFSLNFHTTSVRQNGADALLKSVKKNKQMVKQWPMRPSSSPRTCISLEKWT